MAESRAFSPLNPADITEARASEAVTLAAHVVAPLHTITWNGTPFRSDTVIAEQALEDLMKSDGNTTEQAAEDSCYRARVLEMLGRIAQNFGAEVQILETHHGE